MFLKKAMKRRPQHRSGISSLRIPTQKDHKFDASSGNIVRACLNQDKTRYGPWCLKLCFLTGIKVEFGCYLDPDSVQGSMTLMHLYQKCHSEKHPLSSFPRGSRSPSEKESPPGCHVLLCTLMGVECVPLR